MDMCSKVLMMGLPLVKVAALMLLIDVAHGALPVRVLDAALSPPPPGGGKLWVLLVAGSSGYTNYRHQADVCHAYQAVHGRGVPKEQIIVMIFDDVAKSFFNTRKGALYNEPGGPDVYAGVPKDYTKRSITPKNFLAVLSGDRKAMQEVPGSGRVIESGPNDRIFVYFADHGAPGMLAFPSKFVVVPTKLLARDLIRTIEDMHAADRFSQMLIYVEACESGSMFHGLLKPDLGVLAVTAASPNEPSMACYYNNTLGTFLGDCFSNHWLEHQVVCARACAHVRTCARACVRACVCFTYRCVYAYDVYPMNACVCTHRVCMLVCTYRCLFACICMLLQQYVQSLLPRQDCPLPAPSSNASLNGVAASPGCIGRGGPRCYCMHTHSLMCIHAYAYDI